MLQEKKLLHPDEEDENSETWYASFYNTALQFKKCVLHTKTSAGTMTPKCAALVTFIFVCKEYFISVLECIDIEAHRDFKNSL